MKIISYISSLILCFIFSTELVNASPLSKKHVKKLNAALETQPEEVKARFTTRHPKETLEFFEIKPGMKVLEALPGGGWYSKILASYLGKKGELVAVDYDWTMWPKFGFFDDAFIQKKKTWSTDWLAGTEEWNIKKGAKFSAYTFATIPESQSKSLDAALFIRALHNLSRFENDGEYLSRALAETYRVLKPGGIVGVVQHETQDAAAIGDQGYLERNNLIKSFEKAGFKFVGSTDVNLNPKDKADGLVWRLPPTFYGSKEGDAKRKEYVAIGESNRMTLKFVKPKK